MEKSNILTNISVAILGPGAVGGTIASIFWKKNINVTVVCKENAAKEIQEKGIAFESKTFGNFIARPKSVSELSETPDILFVTTKAPALPDALCRVHKAVIKRTVVVPLLNGLEHMEVIRKHLAGRMIAGAISIEAEQSDSGIVFHRSPFVIIRLASDGEVDHKELLHILLFLRKAGIDVRILKSEKAVFWGKLVRLCAIACATAASGADVGFVRRDPFWRRKLEGAVREGSLIAQKEGVPISPDATLKEIDMLPEMLRTSLQRDIENRKPSELDAIAGAVVRAGERYGIDCPTIRELIAIIECLVSSGDIKVTFISLRRL